MTNPTRCGWPYAQTEGGRIAPDALPCDGRCNATPLGQAAGRLVLPKNSVGAAQLKKSAVAGKKPAANAVTGAKLAPNAVTGAKVADGTLQAVDFQPGQLRPGPQGPKGHAGDPGLPGCERARRATPVRRASAFWRLCTEPRKPLPFAQSDL